ncbi:hypothetical protein B9Z55_010953 [Caenorhabditis nigoni]|uniref:Uncharacterized protein n=1 Tax=Caenorhabditis nigoni TaxID=1611254 RepID=A0A2G5UI10_9PELO|nr:hypothetical protein B9Z55_010953 [Caenorhabditis nigoni]
MQRIVTQQSPSNRSIKFNQISTVSNLPKGSAKLVWEKDTGKLVRTCREKTTRTRRRLLFHDVTSKRNKSPNQIRRAQKSTAKPPTSIDPVQWNTESILAQPGKIVQANWYNVDYPEEQCEAQKGERR